MQNLSRWFAYPFVWAVVVLIVFASTPSGACDDKTDCVVASGDYRIDLPDGLARDAVNNGTRIPAILYVHGLGGSSEETMRNKELRDLANRKGAALIAVNGRAHSWTFENAVERGTIRDERAYFREVIADATKRFPLDHARIIAAGFSIGASMVWNLACYEPQNYAGFITIAGTFWRPQPAKCDKPIGPLFHVHGLSDQTFPIEGRIVEDKHQGDIRDTFTMINRQDQCSGKIIERASISTLRCRLRRNCAGEPIRFCLHAGGHAVSPSFIELGYDEITRVSGW